MDTNISATGASATDASASATDASATDASATYANTDLMTAIRCYEITKDMNSFKFLLNYIAKKYNLTSEFIECIIRTVQH